jgi:hypothetical protein
VFNNWSPRHEGVLGEWRYSFTHSLTSVLDGGEWLASRPGRFTPRETASDIHWIGGWVGPRLVLDELVKRRIPSPRRESNPRTPFSRYCSRYTNWAIVGLPYLITPDESSLITSDKSYLISRVVFCYIMLCYLFHYLRSDSTNAVLHSGRRTTFIGPVL